MAQANYPYLDLTVLPQIRGHVLAPNALLLFDRSLERVLWANGEGTRLIGSPTVRNALENNISPNLTMMRQIKTAVERLSVSHEVKAMMRVRSGYKTRLLSFTVRAIKLPNGEEAILLRTEDTAGKNQSLSEMAHVAVNCLDGYSNAAAVLDEEGNTLAASEHFTSLKVSAAELRLLVQEVSKEDDRLVKRLIGTDQGDLPAGIARLDDDPASHLLIIASRQENVASTKATNTTQQESAAAYTHGEAIIDENENNQKPKIGVFSNNRNLSRSGAERWYYRAQPSEVANNQLEEATGREPEQTEKIAESINDSPEPETIDTQKETSVLINDLPVEAEVSGHETDENENFHFKAGSKSIRFVWEMDGENIFRSISPELAEAVGSESANILGKSWAQVGEERGFEKIDTIGALLKSRVLGPVKPSCGQWRGQTYVCPLILQAFLHMAETEILKALTGLALSELRMQS